MAALGSLLLAISAVGAGDTALLVFTSPQCPHCRRMETALRRLEQTGFPVRRIDALQQGQVARQHRIQAVPTFVMLRRGREVERLEAATSFDRLVRLFAAAGVKPRGLEVRGQSPAGGLLSGAVQALAGDRNSPPAQPPAQPAAKGAAKSGGLAPAAAKQRAQQATVRLKVEDATGYSFGTGTIVDARGSEALILTCGHLFRSSRGRGPIEVTVYTSAGKRNVPGTLIAFEPDHHDIGLVAIRPGVAVTAVPIAADVSAFRQGDSVFNIGCNHGADPTLRESRIVGLNRVVGAPNIEAAGRPAIGRSGGGLFTRDGRLIGVCKLANAQDNEGIYASLESIQHQLKKHGLASILPSRQRATLASSARVAAVVRGGSSSRQVSATAAEAPPRSRATASPSAAPAQPTGAPATGTPRELICIVRSPNDPQGRGQVIVLRDDVSRNLIDRILRESQHQESGRGTDVRTASRNQRATGGRGANVVRGQSP